MKFIRWSGAGALAASMFLVACSGSSNSGAAAKTAAASPLTAVLTQATYDPTLGAPLCATVGPGCTSGTLLAGRDTVSGASELNQPNTLQSSCPDGSYVSSQLNGSIEAIRIGSADGGDLTVGGIAQVEVDVNGPTSAYYARVLVFAATDASAPVWQLIGTVNSPTPGPQTLSYAFTFNDGPVQALRARLVYASRGEEACCATCAYDDVDDLAFAVAPGTRDSTPPTVAITTPADGAAVSGIVPIQSNATDDRLMLKVHYLISGVLAGGNSGTVGDPTTTWSAPWTYSWDTTQATAGTHTITAQAYDGAFNLTESTITLTVLDVTPPFAWISSPVAGATVSGTVTVSGSFYDVNGVALGELLVNGVTVSSWVPPAGANSSFSIPWDTTQTPNGTVDLTARGTDPSGNVGTRTVTGVVVANAVPDTTPPVTAITAPINGASIARGFIDVTATATDNVAVARVDFYADGALIGSSQASPYTVRWDARRATLGTHTLEARAYDTSGNTGSSGPVVVTLTRK